MVNMWLIWVNSGLIVEKEMVDDLSSGEQRERKKERLGLGVSIFPMNIYIYILICPMSNREPVGATNRLCQPSI